MFALHKIFLKPQKKYFMQLMNLHFWFSRWMWQ